MDKMVGALVAAVLGAVVMVMGYGAFENLRGGAEAIVEYQTTKNEQMEALLEDVMNGDTSSDDFSRVQEELEAQYEELLSQFDGD